ncbi:MAG: carboxypeptidase M32 [Alphaproteobacteria bacterium]|nr:carboxypeptidase M32 [Alphaproteobacteria bacterium]
MTAYAELERRFRRLSALNGALAVLNWDQSAMMPEGGAEARAEQVATLGVIVHEHLADPEVAELLASAEEGAAALDPWRRANLREMRRQQAHATALPAVLVDARARANSACEMAWRAARAENDFAALRPHLEEVLRLVREVAAAKAHAFGIDPYDALLDEYEPDGRAAEIDGIFAELRDFLPDLLGRVLERQARAPRPLSPAGPFPVERQRALGLRFMEALGFDFHHGRLDVSLHPFTGGVPDDVRITTRYSEGDFTRALMGVLHETGHALYERGLPGDWRTQPVGQSRGMALHESQSLLVEMQVCRSDAFLDFAVPEMRRIFDAGGPAWEVENIAALYRRAARSLIRVDADEVSYPLHVILRYRLERAMLAGDLAVADLPGAWNEGMERLLGIRPPDDRDGCLQDIHWPGGAFGYFPTYTLGALAAAQLYAAARERDGGIEPAIARGDFQPLLRWLRREVHGRGSSLSTDGILRQATGAPLGTEAFRRHLEQRYLI